MLRRRIFRIFLFIFGVTILSFSMNAQTPPIQWSYALVEPDSNNADPYIIAFPDFNDPIVLTFPEQVDVTLFTPSTIQLNALSIVITPHILSGGYFTSTSGTSSPTFNSFTNGSSLVGVDGQSLISGFPELRNTVVSNPITIFARQGIVISDQNYNYLPSNSASYNICNGSSVNGVVAFDFNSGNTDTSKPSFQILNLGDDPIRFSMPTLSSNTPDTFIAATNTSGPNGSRLSVELYDERFLGPDDFEELYKFVTWDRISSLSDYWRIERAYVLNAGGGFYAIGATNVVTYPEDIILVVETQEPECRTIQEQQRVTLRQRGVLAVREYALGHAQSWIYQSVRPDPLTLLFTDMDPNTQVLTDRGEVDVRITHILDNGIICYVEDDGGSEPESTPDPLSDDSEVRCIEAWRVDIEPLN